MIAMNKQSLFTPSAYLDVGKRHFNLLWQAAFFMVALFMITLLFWWADPRQLDGASVWSKPLKFESSLAMYFITLALLAGLLPTTTLVKPAWQWAVRFSVGAGIIEMIYIAIQAARGRASHYNNETAIEATMYALMGVGAVTLVAVSGYLGWLLYRDYCTEKTYTLKLAAAWGLMLGSVLTLLTAGIMSSSPSHFAGIPAPDAWIVPIVGWSLSGGDLRIPHFFATHLMQLLPLYALWLQRQTIAAAAAQHKVMVFSWLYSVLVLTGLAAGFIV